MKFWSTWRTEKLFQGNEFEGAVCRMSAILLQPRNEFTLPRARKRLVYPKHLIHSVVLITLTLKRKGSHVDTFVATDCTWGGHDDHPEGIQWIQVVNITTFPFQCDIFQSSPSTYQSVERVLGAVMTQVRFLWFHHFWTVSRDTMCVYYFRKIIFFLW